MPVEPRTARVVRVARRRLLGVILPAVRSPCKWRFSDKQSNPKVRSDTRSVIFERGRRGQTSSDFKQLESFEAVSLQSGCSGACHRVDRRQCRTVEPNIGRQRRIPSRGFGLRDACVLCPFNRRWRGELPTRRLAEPNLLKAMVAYFGAHVSGGQPLSHFAGHQGWWPAVVGGGRRLRKRGGLTSLVADRRGADS